jgi:polyphosphate kinase
VVFPVLEPKLADRLRNEILEAYLRDDVKARLMQPDGSYGRAKRTGAGFAAQDWLMDHAHNPESKIPPRTGETQASAV